MSITTDKEHPGINQVRGDGQNEAYLVLSEEERAKGFIRPLRLKYVHVGKQPKYELRDLTDEEKERHAGRGYVKFEKYPEPESSVIGRYWTEEQLKSGCGVETVMAREIAETYARDPGFYGATFCTGCGRHLPVDEFQWSRDGTLVGS